MPVPIHIKRNVLALDLGGTCGWAYLSKGKPVYGTWSLTTENEGSRSYLPALKLKRILESDEIAAHKFDMIAYEETFAQGVAKLRLDSLQTIAVVWAIERNLPWGRIAPTSLKKFATGNGRCGKEQMVDAAKNFFRCLKNKPLTYDEADALCVLAWALGY